MSTRYYALLVLSVILLAVSNPASGGESSDQLLIVIPARYTVVQFAFDIEQLRPSVHLVAYDDASESSGPVMHVWDGELSDWVQTSIEEYSSGALFRSVPQKTLLVGTDTMPSVLLEASAPGGEVRRVPTLGVVDLVNALNEELVFTVSEWRWLAGRYGLKLKDLNADRRRHGRYGPPGGKKQQMSRPMPTLIEREVLIINLPNEIEAMDEVEPVVERDVPTADEVAEHVFEKGLETPTEPETIEADVEKETAPEDK